MDPDQTAPKGAVWSGSMLFVYIPKLAIDLSIYMRQTTLEDDDIFYIRWRPDLQHSRWRAGLIILPLWTAKERLWVWSQVQPHIFLEINLFLLLIQFISLNIWFENSKRTVTLTLSEKGLLLSADNLCNQFGPRSDPTEHWAWSAGLDPEGLFTGGGKAWTEQHKPRAGGEYERGI